MEEFVQYKDTKYYINKLGQVIGPHKKLISCRAYISKDRYIFIHIKNTNLLLHRMVAQTFIPNPNNYPVVNHIDGNKHNNSVNNLEWCSHRQNTKHYYDNLELNPNKKPLAIYKEGIHIMNSDSIKQASEITGIAVSGISKCLNHNTGNRKGYIFKYLDI